MSNRLRLNSLLFFLLAISHPSSANYRHYHLDNADICNGSDGDAAAGGGGGILGGNSAAQWFGLSKTQPTRVLNIGTGAAIFTLSSPSSKFQPSYSDVRGCEVHLKAADDSYGLMAYVEQMHMRKSTKDGVCVDSVQFGQNDRIPYVTLYKSPKYCGEVSAKTKGIFYDDPHGSLLLWVSLGGRMQSPSWPVISVVNLTLVVTAYQKNCAKPRPNFSRCRERDRCIWSHYFCDKHVNCAKDAGTPADEEGCTYEVESATKATSGEGGGDGSGQQSESSFNLVSLTLITVCSGISVLFLLVVILRFRQQKRCCFWQGGSDGNAANVATFTNGEVDIAASQRARSLAELSRIRRLRETPEAANIYLPMETFRDPTRSSSSSTALMETSMTRQQLLRRQEEEESPPAYDELFPDRPGPVVARGEDVNVGDAAASATSQNVPAVQSQSVQDGEQAV